ASRVTVRFAARQTGNERSLTIYQTICVGTRKTISKPVSAGRSNIKVLKSDQSSTHLNFGSNAYLQKVIFEHRYFGSKSNKS
ncbi:hypothetical protein, partial [Yersinia mollaretii]|uniref:hypothetical protein n=1 Tax=Yersinia mollaretii TaxID=33060 RepID=UPI001C127320